MIALLLESALRAFALGAAVWLGLKVLRIRNARAEKTAWRIVLFVSLAMPLLVQFVGPWARVTIPVPMPPQVTAPSVTKIEAESSTRPTPSPGSAVEPMALPMSPVASSDALVSEPPPTTPRHSIDWQALMAAVYLAVAAVLLARLLIGIALIVRLVWAARPLREGWTAGCDVRVGDAIIMPVTFGRTILLPGDCADWSALKRLAVLSHEQSHIDQGDFWILLVASLNRAVFWFNPLSWWLLRRLTELAEIISDDAAIEAIGDSPAYAEILLDIAWRRSLRRIILAAGWS
jgi:beta-lactamase regulating signal transducer with metallopeptidase domain